MLEAVKLALRITSSVFDEDLQATIDACKVDLRLAGAESQNNDDPLLQRAVVWYCKANFGSNPDWEKYARAYEALKISLSLAGDFRA